ATCGRCRQRPGERTTGGCQTTKGSAQTGSFPMKKSVLSALAVAASLGFAGTAWADVTFAVGAPLTGPNAAFGAQIQKGAEKAIADINAAGGMNGEQITIVLGDDQSDPKQGVSVANKFVA